jgi:two-component system cell cycle sensor histidine kinase/response regulator CckA
MLQGMCRYVVAVGMSFCVVLAIAPFAPNAPVGLLLLPVLGAAYIGRLGAGLVALAIATLGTAALVDLSKHLEVVRLISVVIIGAAICGFVEALHRSRAREHASRLVAERVAQRGHKVFSECGAAMSLSRLDNGVVVEVNRAYLALFGLSEEQVLGKTPGSAGVVTDPEARTRAFERLRRGESLDEWPFTIQTQAGEKTLMLWSRAVELGGVSYALSTFLDITQRVAAEAAAHASDQRFNELADSLEEVVFLIEPDNASVLFVNRAYEKVWGRSVESLYADPRSWLAAVHPEDRDKMERASHNNFSEEPEYQFRIVRDGHVRTIQIRLSPVLDAAGRVVRVSGLARDVTDHTTLEEQMRQAQKLESLGLLAGGVAHDFNNILAVFSANAGMLAEQVADPLSRELVGEIEDAVGRATALTRQLLAFSRKQTVEPVVVDLNRTVTDTRKMLRRMVGEDVVIETSLDPEAGCVLIDPGYLVQVIMNLAVNARDAMPRGGTLSISTRNIAEEPRKVAIVITDTGTGMPPEVIARVFEPFFTTKGIGKGTGLGLSVVHGIVRQANGDIAIGSIVGVGTSITISFPHVDAPPMLVQDSQSTVANGTERIVVVDDDLFVRRATARALRSHGYDVLEASDGSAALRLLGSHGDSVGLLVTDVVMPAMDGHELVETARRRRPSLKVLYMSGYTDDSVLRHGVNSGVIEKPFRGHVLATRVRQLLDAGS